MTTYAILGGGGSFGIHTALYLLDQTDTDRVVGIGRAPLRPKAFTLGIEDRWGYEYRAFHVGNELDLLTEYLDELKPDVIVNYAAQGEGAVSWKHSWRFFDTNATALARLYETLSARDWFADGRFVHIGTSELYGSVDRPAAESDPIQVSSPYSASKAAFDLYLLAMARAGKGAPMNIIRPSNAYCPGQLLHRIIPKTVICGLTGQKVPLHGGGKARKSYIHARDLADAIYRVARHGKPGKVYNVGPPEPVSIRELCERTALALDMPFGELFDEAPERIGQDSQYWLDSSAIYQDTGWQYATSLDEGLAEMVAWGREHIDMLRNWPTGYTLRA